MSNSNETNAAAPAVKARSSQANAFYVGGFLALVFVSIKTLTGVTSVFVGDVMPYIAGIGMFAALIAMSAFFLLLRAQKNMRRSKSLRISFGDGYTAVSIFVTMGFFATACMHAFLADGHAVELWNNGLMAAGLSATGYGLGKFCGSLWTEGKA